MTDDFSAGWPVNASGRSISLIPVEHDPFNDVWANGSSIDPSGLPPSSIDGTGRSISLLPVDHDPFNNAWANDPFNNSSTNLDPIDPSGMRRFYMSGHSLTPVQSPIDAGLSPPTMSSGVGPGLIERPPAPTPLSRSLLFNRSPAPEPPAPGPDAASRDQIYPSLAGSDLPLSKSGVPFVPPPPNLPQYPRPSFSKEPGLDLARLVAPNIVDYLTKPTSPPPWPSPSISGKVKSHDNPYAARALLEGASFLGPGPIAKAAIVPVFSLVRLSARIAEEVAPGTVAKVVGKTGSAAAQTLDRATMLRLSAALREAPDEVLARIGQEVAPDNPQLMVGPYRDLRGNLPRGTQAHHYGQNAVFGRDVGDGLMVPRNEGLSVGLKGDVITEPDSPHSLNHQYMELALWDLFRRDGSRYLQKPTNAEYNAVQRRALIVGGVDPLQASDVAAQWAARLPNYGLRETSPVPRIPNFISESGR